MANFVFQLFAMSLFYQHNINPDTKLAVWHIEEPEDFFLAKGLLAPQVAHPHKRLQHLAGRYLLPFLFADFPLAQILIAETRKPFLEKEDYHFSISHCGDFAAAIVSRNSRVGVDLERVDARILSIGHKFLSHSEKELLQDSNKTIEDLTLIWSAKEAIFKWFGKGGLSFKEHIQLKKILFPAEPGWIDLFFVFKKELATSLLVKGKFFDQMTLAWVKT